MLDSDVLGLASGDRAIRFRPNLALTQEEADEGLDRLTRALATVL
jgi:acetylornithine/succinyldiaminopimelate/putrescine aminotransferase